MLHNVLLAQVASGVILLLVALDKQRLSVSPRSNRTSRIALNANIMPGLSRSPRPYSDT